MSFKRLFSRSLDAAPGRLHMAAHSHHLWPDASFAGHQQAWLDAAALADRKWDKVIDEVWPEAQRHVAAELGVLADRIVFSSNTHDFLIRLFAAAPRREGGPLRILTSDGEFHSARRQLARWEEEGDAVVTRVPAEPFDSFSNRFLEVAAAGGHDFILVSHVLFSSGRVFEGSEELAVLARPDGPWVVIDGYHAFMAIEDPLPDATAETAFYLGGGYKYAMAGEGCAFLHCPPGFGPRPPVTGWFAEFGDLTAPPGSSVGYTRDAMRFMGATFDPSALYRFNAIQRMLRAEGLTTAAISSHVAALQQRLLDAVNGTPLGEAELLNPLGDAPHARFLAFRSPKAADWSAQLLAKDCVTDLRGNVLRIGLALYHDEADIDTFAALAQGLD
ncbi:MAG TPA: class V aminotransferase [Sphingomicrobium sp.]|nr:class V aminotransferase [Sphingomicrobium sp.]